MKLQIHLTRKKQINGLLGILLLANICAFAATHRFFSLETTGQKAVLEKTERYFVSGFQVLEWGFSLMDYFESVNDKKN